MIYVQHLLGIGHFQRAAFLAEELVRQNFKVRLVSGGMPTKMHLNADIEFYQLPPLRSLNTSFDTLVDEFDNVVNSAWEKRRSDILVDCFKEYKPDVLITETFPFGRRMMRFELLPLLQIADSASERPFIMASIRDILQPKSKASRNQEICELIDRYYDRVLVHGDEVVATLKDSFAMAQSIADKTFYTGYISNPGIRQEPGACAQHDGEDEVLVSAGGGAVGLSLLETALNTRTVSNVAASKWRLLVGHNLNETDFQALKKNAGTGFVVERNRPDFTSLLTRCRISISQAGYNTMVDVLASGVRAVVVPFAQSGELEQKIRARKLAKLQRLTVVEEHELTPSRLADAITKSLKLTLPKRDYDLSGAAKTAHYLRKWLTDGKQ